MKEKTKTRKGKEDTTLGDAWTFVAIERYSKLILAWHLGRRTESDTIQFTEKIARATEGNFQITTDGFRPYQHAVVLSLGAQWDFSYDDSPCPVTAETINQLPPVFILKIKKAIYDDLQSIHP